MENLDFSSDAFLAFDGYDSQRNYPYLSTSTWPLPLDPNMSQPSATAGSRRANTTAGGSSQPATTTAPLQTAGLAFTQALDAAAPSGLLAAADWPPFQLQQAGQPSFLQDGSFDAMGSFGAPLQSSPTDLLPTTTTQALLLNTSLPLDVSSAPYMPLASAPMEPMNSMAFQVGDLADFIGTEFSSTDLISPSVAGSSPGETSLEIRSISSSSDFGGWSIVDRHQPFDLFPNPGSGTVFNPLQTLHNRTYSDSSQQSENLYSAGPFGSWEDLNPFALHSPQSDNSFEMVQAPIGGLAGSVPGSHHSHSPMHAVSPSAADSVPMKPSASASTSASPSSSGVASPPARRRKSPTGSRVQKTIVKKPVHSTKKDGVAETVKRVGRRRGPLRPDQRQQAHEIRKLRACLRCKFLKKTCDKGDPCAGCQPSHARLWQVPCTRIDIKDIAYFMKDWKADFERHVSLGFSIGNIKGFSTVERPLFITHGYGYFLPITAREVYVRDENCFGIDWVESIHEKPKEFEVKTAKLTAGVEGVSTALLHEYLDKHIDGGFERFVDEYFEGTFFLTEILKTAYRFYLREKLPIIRKALKLVLAYNLTLHVTMVVGLSDEEGQVGKIESKESKFCGKTVAPVMINFQVKCALAEMWRELQKDILEELSALYSSVYSGEKLKNWPRIFILAAILLAVWEEMQFDCHYRVPDPAAVQKFCSDMESTPVGVIVGLFSAISTKLPSFTEWDTRKHHQMLNSNPAVCDAMTEVRQHVTKYEPYLRSRGEAKFDRNDFDSLSNKFLAKLVIRNN